MDLKAAVSVAELAAILRLSTRAVSDLVRRQVLTKRGRGFRLDEAVGDYAEHCRRATRQASPSAQARAELLQIQAQHARKKYERECGDLVSAKDVEQRYRADMLYLRNEFLRIANIVGYRAPHLDRPTVLAIEIEIRRILTDFAEHRGIDGQGEREGMLVYFDRSPTEEERAQLIGYLGLH
jgi:phage terminase Nu1 subunit (DNA packaging protein)